MNHKKINVGSKTEIALKHQVHQTQSNFCINIVNWVKRFSSATLNISSSNSSLNSKTFAGVSAPNQSQYVVDYQAVWVQSTSLAHARMETKCSQLNDTFEQLGGNFTTHLALFSIV